jgi:hypothetical protein
MVSKSIFKSSLLKISLIVASALVIFSWVFASAPGGSPDEPAHFVSIYCFDNTYKKSCESLDVNNYNLAPVKDVSSCYLYQRDRGAGCEVSNIFAKLEKNQTSVFKPFAENYYYKSLSFLTSDYYVISLLGMRAANGFLAAFILFVGFLIFPKNLQGAFALSTLLISIPLGIYLVTSISSTAWLIIGVIGVWSALYSLIYELNSKIKNFKLNMVRVSFLLFSLFIATSSRFDGIYFILILVFALFMILLIPISFKILQKFLSIPLILLIIGSSLLLITSITFYLFKDRANVAYVDSDFNFFDRVFQNLSRLPHLLLGPLGSWGLGWLDVWLSPITYISMYLIILGIIFFSVQKMDITHSVAIAVLVLGIIALPLLVLQASGYQVGEWVQPRYILPLYFPFFGLLLVSASSRGVNLNKPQLAVVFTLASIAHSFALHSNIERYVRGQNTYSLDLTVEKDWWWDHFLSPNYIWIIGTLAFAFVLFVVVQKYFKEQTKVGPEGLEPPTPAL